MRNFDQYLRENRNAILGIEYHSGLNKKVWKNDKLKPDLRPKLIEYARKWLEYARLPEEAVEDIVLTGSLANLNYTSLSDFDVHIIVDPEKLPFEPEWGHQYILDRMGEFKRGHDIKLLGYPVEFYAQMDNETFTAGGIYSLLKNKWIKHPINLHLDFSQRDDLVAQVLAYADQIDNLDNIETAELLKSQLHQLRANSLASGSEFSDGNLVFKSLRNRGDLEKLKDFIKAHENI